MNHYDDLQRFQEKTRTQNLNFQDLSSQAATREHGDWAILNQLNPGAEKPLFWRWEARSPRRCRSRCLRICSGQVEAGRSSGANLLIRLVCGSAARKTKDSFPR